MTTAKLGVSMLQDKVQLVGTTPGVNKHLKKMMLLFMMLLFMMLLFMMLLEIVSPEWSGKILNISCAGTSGTNLGLMAKVDTEEALHRKNLEAIGHTPLSH